MSPFWRSCGKSAPGVLVAGTISVSAMRASASDKISVNSHTEKPIPPRYARITSWNRRVRTASPSS